MNKKIFTRLVKFSFPFLVASFLQTFYGLADLFITGLYNKAEVITAVSVGSQVMHMITVVVVGLTMGLTVMVGYHIGARQEYKIKIILANSIVLFLVIGAISVTMLMLFCDKIICLLDTPGEAVKGTKEYLLICFFGTIFIIIYNIISSTYRGLGDSKTPMYFVAVAGVANIVLDFVFIGGFNLEAKGAAMATVMSQLISVVLSITYSTKKKEFFRLSAKDFVIDISILKRVIYVGIPIAVQDGFIQISFLVITAIANGRGLEIAAAVGIVEKLISFMFLVPSAMLSTVSSIAAQNAGAKLHRESKHTLFIGVGICILSGIFFTIICELLAEDILTLFASGNLLVVKYGSQYLRAYVLDCIVAGIHFCFSGFFCAYELSVLSFVHNIISIVIVRVPGAYLASKWYPDNLFPMGLFAPLGSLMSALICVVAFLYLQKNKKITGE